MERERGSLLFLALLVASLFLGDRREEHADDDDDDETESDRPERDKVGVSPDPDDVLECEHL